MKHRFLRIAFTGLLVIGFMASLSITAFANLTGSTFEGNDGNLVVDKAGDTDWATVANVNIGIDLPSGTGDNSFGQGTKEDVPAVTVVNGSIPPNKNDLTRFYEASEQASNQHIYLYLGWERLVNIGNANLDFEINQFATTGFTSAFSGPITLNRTAGDLLVTYDFSGSGTPTLGLNTWLTSATVPVVTNFPTNVCYSSNTFPCWGDHVTLGSSIAEGAVNTGTVTDPLQSPAASLGPGLFGEAAIDLTAAGVFPPGVCEAFGSTFVKSRSSSSFTAEIKDFIAPVAVNISNCGTITIHKVTENGNSSFGYTTTGNLTPSTFSLSNGGTQNYPKVPSGSYSVTENLTPAQVTAGWTFKSLVCTSGGSGTSTAVNGDVASITMGLGGNVVCTYTNHINLSPTIGTKLSQTVVNIGDSVTDQATLTGATANAGGSVTYSAYAGQNTCTGTDLLNSTVTVTNGAVPPSAAFVPSAAGYYSFQAAYSGDGNNNPATSDCTTEQLLVKANPAITTDLSSALLQTVPIGFSVFDTAVLTGATSDAGGTVTYHAFFDTTCSGTDLFGLGGDTVNVTNGVVPNSASITVQNAGDYSFLATYSGDAKNNPATDVCSTEQLVVVPNTPAISTAQNLLPNDAATITLATSHAGGTITFSLFDPNSTNCSGTPAYTQTVTVSGNGTYVTTNTTFLATIKGTWDWLVTYSGDSNNLPATSACGVESFTITQP